MKIDMLMVSICMIALVFIPIFFLIGFFGKKKNFFYGALWCMGIAVLSFILFIIIVELPPK